MGERGDMNREKAGGGSMQHRCENTLTGRSRTVHKNSLYYSCNFHMWGLK